MKFIDWLRKLGILRFGAEKAVYHNAKERPFSMQHPGVFDSEKDVVHFGRPVEKKESATDGQSQQQPN